jgi:hypothetical protein
MVADPMELAFGGKIGASAAAGVAASVGAGVTAGPGLAPLVAQPTSSNENRAVVRIEPAYRELHLLHYPREGVAQPAGTGSAADVPVDDSVF